MEFCCVHPFPSPVSCGFCVLVCLFVVVDLLLVGWLVVVFVWFLRRVFCLVWFCFSARRERKGQANQQADNCSALTVCQVKEAQFQWRDLHYCGSLAEVSSLPPRWHWHIAWRGYQDTKLKMVKDIKNCTVWAPSRPGPSPRRKIHPDIWGRRQTFSWCYV